MDWLYKFVEWVLSGGLSLLGKGISSAGEGMAQNVPAGRLMDVLRARRRMSKEMQELHTLSTRLSRYADSAEQRTNLCWRVIFETLNPTPDELTSPIVQAAVQLCRDILRHEGFFPLPKIDFSGQLALGEIWKLTNTTRRQLAFYEDEKRQGEIFETLRQYVYNLIHERLPKLPAIDTTSASALLFVPLYGLHRAPAEDMDALINITFQKPEDESLFLKLGETLMRNTHLASGINPESQESHKPIIYPNARKDKSPDELIELYLAQTPFKDFFMTNLPFTFDLDTRFEHMEIVGGSGHGKTQLLQSLILDDLPLIREGRGSVIVIDSQGDMFRKIQQLAIVGEMPERVVLIDPNEIDSPPALNLFDFGLQRLNTYDRLTQEMLVNGAIALFGRSTPNRGAVKL